MESYYIVTVHNVKAEYQRYSAVYQGAYKHDTTRKD